MQGVCPCVGAHPLHPGLITITMAIPCSNCGWFVRSSAGCNLHYFSQTISQIKEDCYILVFFGFVEKSLTRQFRLQEHFSVSGIRDKLTALPQPDQVVFQAIAHFPS